MVTALTTRGVRAVQRCRMLGHEPYSDEKGMLYRGYLTPAHRAANEALARWMEEAGMTTRLDNAGNLVGRYEGSTPGPALMIGSHIDSVRNGGAFDGPLGIMLGIECVAALSAAARRVSFPIEVIAFGDEEGSRFPAAMMTSRAVAGTLDMQALDSTDGEGISVRDALRDWGLDGASYASAHRSRDSVFAYLEAHIEQGPVLEARGLPVGIVSAIAAQRRYLFTVTGNAAHAGTTPMDLREDALTAAAEMIAAVNGIARNGTSDLVATVGRLDVSPNASNVVPGKVEMTLDVRAGSDAARNDAAGTILDTCAEIAREHSVGFETKLLQVLPASPVDPRLADDLEAAIVSEGISPLRLVSGAGHDAMVMAALCPMTMLFIRCRDGVSHNPAEDVSAEDAEVALRVMQGFIERLGKAHV